jgi:hypothetical protein
MYRVTIVRYFARNAMVLLALAATLLTVFEMSSHRLAVLPADASPGPVLAGALVLAAAATIVEGGVRRRLR